MAACGRCLKRVAEPLGYLEVQTFVWSVEATAGSAGMCKVCRVEEKTKNTEKKETWRLKLPVSKTYFQSRPCFQKGEH